MRTTTYLLVLASLAFFPVRVARGEESNAQRLFGDLDANHDGKLTAAEVNSDQRPLVKRLVRTGDDDGDGRLSAAEFAAALEPKRADKNLVKKAGSRLPGADALVVFMAKMDANHDHQLESKEIPADYKPLFEQMLKPGDRDDNGKLDQRELAQGAPRLGIIAQLAAARRGIDVDAESKKLSSEDRATIDRMDAYGRPVEMLADPKRAAELFKRLDANGDQQLTIEEVPPMFSNRFGEMFQRGDANGDEKLSKKEFLELSNRVTQFQTSKAEPEAVRRFKRQLLSRFDRNGDGKLAAREAPPRLAQSFDRADLDSNGYLDDAELTKAAEMMVRLEKAGMGPRQGARPNFSPVKRQALKKAERKVAKAEKAVKSDKKTDKPGSDGGDKKPKPAKKTKADKVAKKS